VAVFDPTPVLTIVVESLDGKPDVHLHAGGQGVWVARMLVELDVRAHLCAPIGGETGVVLSGLARDEGIQLRSVDSPGSCGGTGADELSRLGRVRSAGRRGPGSPPRAPSRRGR
jgi:1-phosphofructokinase